MHDETPESPGFTDTTLVSLDISEPCLQQRRRCELAALRRMTFMVPYHFTGKNGKAKKLQVLTVAQGAVK